jgi:RsiW-degrading membrane proteinase PrsW (M82 family)
MRWVGFLAALFITIFWLYFVKRIDVFEKERWTYVILTVGLGMLCSFGVFVLNDIAELSMGVEGLQRSNASLLECVLQIGIPEELVKILPLFLILWLTSEIDEPYDYLLYASASALGFAFIENLLYFDGQHLNIIHGRAFASVVCHMYLSSLVAYGIILGRYKHQQHTALWLGAYFLLAALFHGLFDYFAFSGPGLATLILILIFINYWSRIMNNALNNSTYFDKSIQLHSEKLKIYLVIGLGGILVFEYLYTGWRLGPKAANYSLLQSSVQGSLIMLFLVSKLSSFTFLKGYWISLNPLRHFQRGRRSIFGLGAFVAVFKALMASSAPLNYKGYKVTLQKYKYNRRLKHVMKIPVQGEVVDHLTFKTWTIFNTFHTYSRD